MHLLLFLFIESMQSLYEELIHIFFITIPMELQYKPLFTKPKSLPSETNTTFRSWQIGIGAYF